MLSRGGKRIRPLVLLLLADNLSKSKEIIMPFGFFVETVHNATLIIDDIEDGSLTRRGEPCVHLKYGVDTAINAGNYLYFAPFYELLNNPYFKDLSDSLRLKLIGIYVEEMRNIHLGLGWDIYWHKNYNSIPNENHYRQMIESKTAVLFRIGIRFFSEIFELPEAEKKSLINFVNSIGNAFQIVDDLLNISSEEYAKGKGGKGEDITEGKLTLMAIHHLH